MPNKQTKNFAIEEHAFINQDAVSKNGVLSKLPFKSENIASSLIRYTSDSDDCGLESDLTGNFLNYLFFFEKHLEIRFSKRQVGTAYFDYTAKENDELSLKRGSVVEIIQSDWSV